MKRTISLILILALWVGLTAFAWLKPAAASSDAERRPLAQFPELSADTLLSGEFMSEFAGYAVDQFPLRDTFRTLNAWLTYYVFGQSDNNGIYLHDGYAAKMEYPLDESSLGYAIGRFQDLFDMYLSECGNIHFAVVPDKSYYLAEGAEVLRMDYEAMFETLEESLPWAEFIDLTGALSIEDYYRTDTHWTQDRILPAAEVLADALGITIPEFETVTLERPFYGVYYGQAALPMEPDTMRYLTNEVLENCTVKCHDNGVESKIYDMTKLDSRDLYDIFLSGGTAVLEITNPAGEAGKELVIFRDSFGSAMAPLLVQDYAKVWVLDTRYVSPGMLGQFVDFAGKDVLFLYSTLVLNSSSALRK